MRLWRRLQPIAALGAWGGRAGLAGCVVALCLSLFLALPAWAGLYNATSVTLANGLQLVVIEDHRAPVAVHMVWYKVGAADEAPGKSGIAHFLEHLMFKGTKDVPVGQFSHTVALNGGRENAMTTQDFTAYHQQITNDKLGLMMKLEADRMANLRLMPEDVTPELQVILEERRSRIDNEPTALFGEQMAAAQFLNEPYHTPVIGWEHEMEGLTRDDAIAFYQAHYAPNNAVVVVAGDVDAKAVELLAEQTYGRLKRRAVPPRAWPTEPPQLAARRLVMTDARVNQPLLERSYLAPSYSAGTVKYAYPLQVLAEILSGGGTSRLTTALVRNDGPAVSAGAWYDPDSIALNRFSFGLRPKPGETLAGLEAALDRLIAKLLDKGVTAEEMTRAKARLQAGQIYARDSLYGTASLFGEGLADGRDIADIEAWPERIAAVTADQVRDAARAVLVPEQSVTGYLQPKPGVTPAAVTPAAVPAPAGAIR